VTPLDAFNLAMRWLHVAAAVAGVGGALLMRLVLLPTLERTPSGDEALRAIRPRFKRLMHTAIGLLLVTGTYNYIAVAIPRVRAFTGQDPNPMTPYHPVMGAKILLSLALFAIGLWLLAPTPPALPRLKTWLTVNVALGLTILLLAAYLRRLWPAPLPI
jgi:putative copper export protein